MTEQDPTAETPTRVTDTPRRLHRSLGDPLLLLALAAALVTIALTGAGFWLSYEHLHDLAVGHGLAHDTARAWVWPACIDMFIVIGELLVLRGSLARRADWFAIALMTIGSAGSITLNIAAVGTNLPPLDYVVAAIPPTAALLAFGALMRQIHSAIATRVPAAVPVPGTTGYTPAPVYPAVHPPLPQTAPAPRPDVAAPVRVPAAVPAVPALYPPADLYSSFSLQALAELTSSPVPDGVPADRTRVQPVPDFVPEDLDIEPDPDPDPKAGTPDEELADQLRRTYAEELLGGRAPSIRTIRADLGVGQPRATRIQRLLTEGVSA